MRGANGVLAFLGLAVAGSSPAAARVHEAGDAGFVIRLAADVSAAPDAVWRDLVRPDGWWDKQHTFSGDAANLAIDPHAGGCFCEVLPNPESPRAAPRGTVEHMRVIYSERGRLLRMSGALGPLQSEGVSGTLTVALKPVEGGTRILWEYVVGGYMRPRPAEIAPVVDRVLGEQLARLAGKLGPMAGAAPAPATPEGGPPPAQAPEGPPPAAAPRVLPLPTYSLPPGREPDGR